MSLLAASVPNQRIPRQELRFPVWMEATCRTSEGGAEDVVLSDISVDGCGLVGKDGMLQPGQLVIMRMHTLEGLEGTVCWVKARRAGVKFARPLYRPVLDHLVRVQLTVAG
ncbi:MAG: PilZ domain-containing protein [Novosphingobium sp.]